MQKKYFIFLVLVLRGACVYSQDACNNSEFFRYAGVNDVLEYIKKQDINILSSDGDKLFRDLVSYNENQDVIIYFIKKGININDRDRRSGMSALMYASEFNQNPEILQTLIHYGADVGALDKHLDGVIHHCLMCSNIEQKRISDKLRLLVDNGANIELKNQNGAPPIFNAVYNNFSKAVVTLIELGVDVNSTYNNITPIEAAVGNFKMVPEDKRTECEEIILILLNAGADVYHKTDDHMCVIDIAEKSEPFKLTNAYWEIRDQYYKDN
ncbi:MAG: ankyrin repeat domain-containing protein [Spirochaetales bacterium]|nr:ankyrin repeat domain-containing protein [Spirochaetales bacterium]